MERINLTPNTKKTLPVTINGVDYDIEVDTRDIALTTLIISMTDDCVKLEQKIAAVRDTKSLEEMRAVATEALEQSDRFYADMCKLIPSFSTFTQGQPIRDFGVWLIFLKALADLISEGKAQTEVAKTLEDESVSTIGV